MRKLKPLYVKNSFLHFYFPLTERVRLNEQIRWKSAHTVQAKLLNLTFRVRMAHFTSMSCADVN